jgi:exodeoxyribonuclease VII small subunit
MNNPDPRSPSGTHHEAGAPSPRFEDLLAELEQVVAELEAGRLDLEASLAAFERGTRLAREAGAILVGAQARVEQVLLEEDGSAREVPFRPEP